MIPNPPPPPPHGDHPPPPPPPPTSSSSSSGSSSAASPSRRPTSIPSVIRSPPSSSSTPSPSSSSGLCLRLWIPSACSLLCSLGIIWAVTRYKTDLKKSLEREREDSSSICRRRSMPSGGPRAERRGAEACQEMVRQGCHHSVLRLCLVPRPWSDEGHIVRLEARRGETSVIKWENAECAILQYHIPPAICGSLV